MIFEIVPFCREHLDAVEELEKVCFTDPFSRATLESALDCDRVSAFVALDGTKVIGYLEFYDFVDTLCISSLETAPEYRQRGIASAFISIAEAEAARKGIGELSLEVRISNAAARALYEKHGFTVSGLRRGYYVKPVEDAVLYVKQLNKSEI